MMPRNNPFLYVITEMLRWFPLDKERPRCGTDYACFLRKTMVGYDVFPRHMSVEKQI